MVTPTTTISGKAHYSDLQSVIESLANVQFFFTSNKYPSVEILCPIYMTPDFIKRHEKALKSVVILTHRDNGNLYATISKNANIVPLERSEYMVSRLLSELKTMEV